MPTTNKYRIVKRGKIRKGDSYILSMFVGNSKYLSKKLQCGGVECGNTGTFCAIGLSVTNACKSGFTVFRKVSK